MHEEKMKTITDEHIIKVYKRCRNYALTAQKIGHGLSRQTVRNRVLLLRANGINLPPAKKQRKFSLNLGGNAQG